MSTVLVIDDNKYYRESLTEILELENHTALGAENGLVGLQMLHHHQPDVILCDVDMPVMNGLDLLQIVKANPAFAHIPFIIHTGRNDSLTIQRARGLGADNYLLKPITVVNFLSIIADFLQEVIPSNGKENRSI